MPGTIDCSHLGDGELARRVAACGPAGAASEEAELYHRFARRVRLYGLRHLKTADAADDLVQRVLVLTLQKLRDGGVREPDRLGSFVLGVARMVVREHRRGGARMVAVSEAGTELPFQHPVEPDPIALVHLARCLEALAERERTVVVLTYYGDTSSGEIAETLGVSQVHLRVIRHRAIASLRECMGVHDAAREAVS